MVIAVECREGHRGEREPSVITIGSRRLVVTEVRDQWLAPDHRYFKVTAEDGDTYILRHDIAASRWELTMFERSGGPALRL